MPRNVPSRRRKAPARSEHREGLRIFIGSARESLADAKQVARWIEGLRAGHVAQVWNQPGLFVASQTVWHQLHRIAADIDAAIVIFGEDDEVWVRGRTLTQPRDNALLEFGLFAGQVGLAQVAFCTRGNPKTPSDLDGFVFIDISPKRSNTAQYELEVWLKEISASLSAGGRARLKDRTSTPARDRLEESAAVEQVRRYERQNSESDPLTKALATGVSEKLLEERHYPELHERHTRLVIEPNGDGSCSVRETIRSLSRAIRVVPFTIAGDHPVDDPTALVLSVWTSSQTSNVSWHLATDRPTQKSVLLLFDPEIPAGQTVTYEVTWTWPRMWSRLTKGLRDEWRQPVRSLVPIKRSTITVNVSPKLPKLEIQNRGNGGGVAGRTGKRDKQGYHQYLWTMQKLVPGEDVILCLYPVKRRRRDGQATRR